MSTTQQQATEMRAMKKAVHTSPSQQKRATLKRGLLQSLCSRLLSVVEHPSATNLRLHQTAASKCKEAAAAVAVVDGVATYVLHSSHCALHASNSASILSRVFHSRLCWRVLKLRFSPMWHATARACSMFCCTFSPSSPTTELGDEN